MTGREQTRRDAEALERLVFDCEFDEDFAPVAEELKRVRAELEQAEGRESALVEALRQIGHIFGHEAGSVARLALAAYEQEQT